MTKNEGYDTSPKAYFLRALQSQKWTVQGALAELVDNSYGQGRGNADSVWIIYNQKRRIIEILDNGQGMQSLGLLFQLGNTVGISIGDIGQYGSGGTMALLWLGTKVDVWTLRNGLVSWDTVDWNRHIASGRFPIVSVDWTKSTIRNTPTTLFECKHGTLIRIQLNPERRFFAHNVQKELASLYAPGLRFGKSLTWNTIGSEHISLSDSMPELGNENVVNIDAVLEINDKHLAVTGRIGLIPDLPYSKSLVSIGFGYRIIMKTRACYSSENKKYIGTGVFGWLQLGEGWQAYLATTKDAMNDQPALDRLMEYVFKKIEPLLEQVDSHDLSMELDEMAIKLSIALAGKMDVCVEKEVREPGTAEPGGASSGGGGGESGTHDPGQGGKTKAPALTKLTITKQNDAQMEGSLCKVDLTAPANDIEILINCDHDAVQEMLKARPINRMALNSLITGYMAEAILGYPPLLNRVFTRPVREKIDGKDECDRRGYVHRLLMDRVRRYGDEQMIS